MPTGFPRCRAWPATDTRGSCQNRTENQRSRSSNQVTIRPPRRRDPHRTARAATSWSPRPPSASRPAGRSSGVPGPARSVTSTRTTPSPTLTATVTVSPAAPEPECRTELPKISLTSSSASSPDGCPGPSTAETNARAARARSARPASVTVSRTVAPDTSAPAFPAALVPGIGPAAGRTQRMHARLGGARQASTRPQRGPSVPSVETPTVTPTVLPARNPSAMRPWTAQHDGLQRDKVTHAGTERKRPASTRIRS
jgi:hypothetical protein